MSADPAIPRPPGHRVPDWPLRLEAILRARRRMPFRWGFHDCCQWPRRVATELTGEDPAAAWGLRPYRSSAGAARQLLRLGGLAALPARAGYAEIPVLRAGRGDLVLLENAGRPALGVVTGASIAFPGKHSLLFVPLAAAIRAWRVARLPVNPAERGVLGTNTGPAAAGNGVIGGPA